QRWDLATGVREATVPLPFPGTVRAVCLGSSSNGPLLVRWVERVGQVVQQGRLLHNFLDVATLKLADVRMPPQQGFLHFQFNQGADQLRAWADGRMFTIGSFLGGQTQLLLLNGGEARYQNLPFQVGQVVPDPEGKVLYTTAGLFTPDGRPLGQDQPMGGLR